MSPPNEKPAGPSGSAVLDDIAEVVGGAAMLALAEEFMGERVYIPKNPDNQLRIAKAIGADQARKFCEAFWRTSISFPTKFIIDRRTVDLAAQGMTKQEIARTLHIREARVYAVLKRFKAAAE